MLDMRLFQHNVEHKHMLSLFMPVATSIPVRKVTLKFFEERQGFSVWLAGWLAL